MTEPPIFLVNLAGWMGLLFLMFVAMAATGKAKFKFNGRPLPFHFALPILMLMAVLMAGITTPVQILGRFILATF